MNILWSNLFQKNGTICLREPTILLPPSQNTGTFFIFRFHIVWIRGKDAGLCFYSQFHFLLPFRSKVKNLKSDALSPEPQFIIDSGCTITQLQSVLMKFLLEKRLIVSWGHFPKLAGQSGECKSLELISHYYRWHTLSRDVNDFVETCITYLIYKQKLQHCFLKI